MDALSILSLFLVVFVVNPGALVAGQCYNETIALDDDGTIGVLFPDVEAVCTGEGTPTETCTADYSTANTTAYQNSCVARGGQMISYDYWFNCTYEEEAITLNYRYVNDPQCFGKSCENDKETLENFWRSTLEEEGDTESCKVEIILKSQTGSDAVVSRSCWTYLSVLLVGMAFWNLL